MKQLKEGLQWLASRTLFDRCLITLISTAAVWCLVVLVLLAPVVAFIVAAILGGVYYVAAVMIPFYAKLLGGEDESTDE